MSLESKILSLKNHNNRNKISSDIVVFSPSESKWGKFVYAWLDCPNNQGKGYDPEMAFTNENNAKSPKFVEESGVSDYPDTDAVSIVSKSEIDSVGSSKFREIAQEIEGDGYYFYKII